MNLKKEIAFLKVSENLKIELRHSWLSNGERQESVAEHSWRLALMALRFYDRLDQPINLEKALALALIHDLGEAHAGDIFVLDAQTEDAQKSKYENELAGLIKIKELLGDANGEKIFALWHEYEEQQTYESKFIKALDKIEVCAQHNEAPLSTWEPREKLMVFQEKWMMKYCTFDSFLTKLAEAMTQASIEKLIAAGEDIAALKHQASL